MTRNRRLLFASSFAALALAASPALAQVATDAQANDPIVVTAKPIYGTFGVDLTARDLNAKPGDDFERYASGAWMDRTEIPSDRPSTGSFVDLADVTEKQMREVIQEAPPAGKASAMFAAFMNEKAVERAGITPLMADIAKIRAISDKSELARYFGQTDGVFGISLFGNYVDVDPDNPGRYVMHLSQSGLGLPEKDYYLNPRFAPQRAAYLAYLERTFRTIGAADPKTAAADVMELETYIAQLSWDAADRRDIDKTNNPYSSAQLAEYAPGFDWPAFFTGLGAAPQDKLIVDENTAVKRLATLFERTPLETLKLWEQFHVANQASPYLNRKMVDSRFEFIKSLSGVTQQRDRWKRGVALLNSRLGELVGQEYVARHFPAASKAKMEAMVANLKLAMADRIKANSWMTEPTKQAALAKLENTLVMVGYPDEWRDYSSVTITPDDLYGDVRRASAFNAAHEMAKVGKPVDRKEWFMSPQTVNAYNGGQLNEIVFPAAILQPPFFDPAADPAVNYGAIGVVIGHEISHSFDDQGRKIDAEGRIRDWWTPADAERFKAEAKRFGEQYAAFEVVPGAHINPELTMGENIADFAGLNVALDAYHRSLGGEPAPVIDGLTGDQRFFLG
jgi:putative endopeptidase